MHAKCRRNETGGICNMKGYAYWKSLRRMA